MIRRIFGFIIICVVFALFLYFLMLYNEQSKKIVTFSSCVDGDTAWFIVQGKREKVRFLGINAPEIAHDKVPGEEYGDKAMDIVCSMLEKGKDISLQFDINSDRYDKYNRLLAWVFVDGVLLNEYVVSKGYAEVRYVNGDYLYIDELCSAQDMAYSRGIGIWSTGNYQYKNNYCNKR